MRVALLCHDVGNNALGRAHALASLLADDTEVEIIGRARDGRVWEPLRDDDLAPVRVVDRCPDEVRADVLIAVKPRRTSLGWALRLRRRTGVPVVADVDDWELAFYRNNLRWAVRQSVELTDPNNLWTTVLAERQVRRADAVTVSGRWLQRRFGGLVIPHARDADVYDPNLDGSAVRAQFGLQGKRVVVFVGSPRPHKGLPDIIAAVDRIQDGSIAFLVVGATSEELPERSWLHCAGNQPFSAVPQFLAAADVAVLAQRSSAIAEAQVPAKVFDAMGMGRPIVSTTVSDLPEILDGCAVLVPPEDPAALGDGIAQVLGDPAAAAALGRAARERFEAHYSTAALRPRLLDLLRSLAPSGAPTEVRA